MQIAEQQKNVALKLAVVLGYQTADCDIRKNSPSKQVSAVLPQGEEMKYKNKTIKKRADGRWWARYYRDGKQLAVYGKTQKECYDKLKQALQTAPKQTKEKAITLKEWLDKWSELYKRPVQKDSTFYQTQLQIRNLSPLHNIKLAKLTTETIQKFLNSIKQPRKREYIYTVLNDALDKAKKNDVIKKNPCDNVQVAKSKPQEKKTLTQEQEKRFVSACEKVDCGLMFLLCLYQGLRIGEAKALDKADFDFDGKMLTVDKSINMQDKVDSTKSTASERNLPLFEKTINAIKKLGLKIYKSDKKIYDEWKTIRKEVNLDKKFTIHNLRHTFATRCAEAGIAPKICQKWLGHATVDITLRVYTHANDEFEKKETAKLDTYFDT